MSYILKQSIHIMILIIHCPCDQVHRSQAFLFAPSFASNLYLLLLRFLHRDYASVFGMADACVSDTELAPLEAAIWAELKSVESDCHPNAHACRLKIALATLAAASTMPCPWDIEVRSLLLQPLDYDPFVNRAVALTFLFLFVYFCRFLSAFSISLSSASTL